MQQAARIYYRKSDGMVIVITSEMSGDIRSSTTLEDFLNYGDLRGYNPDTAGVIELPFGYVPDGQIVRVEGGIPVIEPYPEPEPVNPKPSLDDRVATLEEVTNIILLGGL